MDITLYYCAKTRAVRIRWLLEELKIQYKLHYIDIFSGAGQTNEYLAIHPFGQVPSIKIDGEIILESGAICSVLADKFPDKSLAPTINSTARSQYQQWMYFAPATLEPPVFQYLLHSVLYPVQHRVTEIANNNLKSYRQILITLEKIFKKDMINKHFLIEDNFSCADIMVGSVLFWVPEIVNKYPRLKNYKENLEQRDAYQRAIVD